MKVRKLWQNLPKFPKISPRDNFFSTNIICDIWQIWALFVFCICVSLYLVSLCLCICYLCILVFGYLCMRRKKKVVVRSRSLRTSESAPPSPLHASDLLLRTATYFFCLLLATYFFLALITTYCMGCKGLFAQWNKFLLLRAFQRSPAKGFYT